MNRRMRSVLLVLSTFLGAHSAWGSDVVLTGDRVSFSTPPLWVSSGAWDANGDSILIADVLANRIRRYGTDGRYLGDVPNGASYPTVIQAGEGGAIWVENEDAELIKLNEKARLAKNLKELAVGPNGALKALYQWVPADSAFLAFGDVLNGEHGFSAFLWISLSSPGQFQILDKIELADPARRYYLLGYPYVATVDGKPFYLVMADIPYIVQPGGRRIRFVHTTATGRVPFRAPELPERRGMETTRLSFERLEESAIPAALYGWDGSLFVLMRAPLSNGETLWRLLKLDPQSGSVNWNRLIDSRASHLTVVPGDQNWGIIEKGSVLAPGQQKIESLLLVPTSLIEK